MWKALSSVWSSIGDAAEFSWIHILPFGIVSILMALINNLALLALMASYRPEASDYVRVCLHPIIAAVQEPVTSKLLGAILVLYIAARNAKIRRIRSKPIYFGLLGGVTVGLVELSGKVFLPLSLKTSSLPPVLMHMTTGAIVSTAVFKYGTRPIHRRNALIIVAATLVGILVHVLWNTQIAFWIAGANPC